MTGDTVDFICASVIYSAIRVVIFGFAMPFLENETAPLPINVLGAQVRDRSDYIELLDMENICIGFNCQKRLRVLIGRNATSAYPNIFGIFRPFVGAMCSLTALELDNITHSHNVNIAIRMINLPPPLMIFMTLRDTLLTNHHWPYRNSEPVGWGIFFDRT